MGGRLPCCVTEVDVNDLTSVPGRVFLVETGAYSRVKAVELEYTVVCGLVKLFWTACFL